MKKKKIIFILLMIIFIVIIFYFIISKKINETSRENNLYNIKNPIEIKTQLEVNGVAIFDEFVYDNFNNEDITLEEFKIYPNKAIIEGTNNFSALEKNKNLLTFIEENNLNIYSKNSIKNLSDSILKNTYNILEIDYMNSINESSAFKSSIIRKIKSYNENKSIIADGSGYIINRLDGFENQFGLDKIGNTDWEILQNNHIISQFKGLKYVNNKFYNLVLYVPNRDDFQVDIFNKEIIINNKKYNFNLKEYYLYENGYIINLEGVDNIENLIKNRFIKAIIENQNKTAFEIPKSSIVNVNEIKGVYQILGGKVVFTPVEIISEKEETILISSNLPEYINNKNDFNKLEPFAKIIINTNNYKNGDFY